MTLEQFRSDPTLAKMAFKLVNSAEWHLIEGVLMANSPMNLEEKPTTNDEVVRAYEREQGYRTAIARVHELSLVIGHPEETESTYEDPSPKETETKE